MEFEGPLRTVQGLVIGKGSIGTRHYKLLQKLLPDGNHLHLGSREFDSLLAGSSGVEFPAAYKDGFDFVIVASPSTRHRHHVTESLKLGLPVLVEKPLTSTLQEAHELSEFLGDRGQLVQVGYVIRFSEGFQALQKEIAKRGLDGVDKVKIMSQSYLPDWRPNTDFREGVSARADLGGGALRELSHELDYAITLLGPLKVSFANLKKSPDISDDVETCALIHASSGHGATVSISLDMASHTAERSCEVTWHDGKWLRWNLLENSLSSGDSSGATFFQELKDSRDDWYHNQLKAFVGAVNGENPPTPTVGEALFVMECIDYVEKISRAQL